MTQIATGKHLLPEPPFKKKPIPPTEPEPEPEPVTLPIEPKEDVRMATLRQVLREISAEKESITQDLISNLREAKRSEKAAITSQMLAIKVQEDVLKAFPPLHTLIDSHFNAAAKAILVSKGIGISTALLS